MAAERRVICREGHATMVQTEMANPDISQKHKVLQLLQKAFCEENCTGRCALEEMDGQEVRARLVNAYTKLIP